MPFMIRDQASFFSSLFFVGFEIVNDRAYSICFSFLNSQACGFTFSEKKASIIAGIIMVGR